MSAVDIYANILRDEACLVKRDRISPVPYYILFGTRSQVAMSSISRSTIERRTMLKLLHPVAEDIRRSSGRPMMYGSTPDGRYIAVVYEEIDDHTLYPATAVVEI